MSKQGADITQKQIRWTLAFATALIIVIVLNLVACGPTKQTQRPKFEPSDQRKDLHRKTWLGRQWFWNGSATANTATRP